MVPFRPTRDNGRKEKKHSMYIPTYNTHLYIWGGGFGKPGPPREAKKSRVALIVGHVTGIIVFGTSILFVCACKSGNSVHHTLDPRLWQGQNGMIIDHRSAVYKSTVQLHTQILMSLLFL